MVARPHHRRRLRMVLRRTHHRRLGPRHGPAGIVLHLVAPDLLHRIRRHGRMDRLPARAGPPRRRPHRPCRGPPRLHPRRHRHPAVPRLGHRGHDLARRLRRRELARHPVQPFASGPGRQRRPHSPLALAVGVEARRARGRTGTGRLLRPLRGPRAEPRLRVLGRGAVPRLRGRLRAAPRRGRLRPDRALRTRRIGGRRKHHVHHGPRPRPGGAGLGPLPPAVGVLHAGVRLPLADGRGQRRLRERRLRGAVPALGCPGGRPDLAGAPRPAAPQGPDHLRRDLVDPDVVRVHDRHARRRRLLAGHRDRHGRTDSRRPDRLGAHAGGPARPPRGGAAAPGRAVAIRRGDRPREGDDGQPGRRGLTGAGRRGSRRAAARR